MRTVTDMSAPTTPPAADGVGSEPTLWRTSTPRLLRLVVGLIIFGIGDALIVLSNLGNSPWTVFAEGLSLWTPMSIGVATIVTGFVLFLLWVPLRVKPGIGTVLNLFLIGIAIDVTLFVLSEPTWIVTRAVYLLAGVAIVGLGSGLYLGTAHGPGPRDGLMTGLHRTTGVPIFGVRAVIELSALGIGYALGGTLGLGTVVFALLIGPAVQIGLGLDRRLRRAPRRDASAA